MNFFLMTLLFFSGHWATAQISQSLEEMRKDFQGIQSEDDIVAIMEMNTDETSPDYHLIRAYQGASSCRRAEYVGSPFTKLKFFKEGKRMLEDSIKKEKSAENIYLRLLVQMNVPGILNYSDKIEEDLEYLSYELPKAQIDRKYKSIMVANLRELAEDDNELEIINRISI